MSLRVRLLSDGAARSPLRSKRATRVQSLTSRFGPLAGTRDEGCHGRGARSVSAGANSPRLSSRSTMRVVATSSSAPFFASMAPEQHFT